MFQCSQERRLRWFDHPDWCLNATHLNRGEMQGGWGREGGNVFALSCFRILLTSQDSRLAFRFFCIEVRFKKFGLDKYCPAFSTLKHINGLKAMSHHAHLQLFGAIFSSCFMTLHDWATSFREFIEGLIQNYIIVIKWKSYSFFEKPLMYYLISRQN